MNSKLLSNKSIFRLNKSLFELKKSKTYLSYRLLSNLNINKTKVGLLSNDCNKHLLNNSLINLSTIGPNINKRYICKLLTNNKNSYELFKRSYSKEPDNESDKSLSNERPVLMRFEPKYWPNFWFQYKNLVITYFVIRPFFDNEFTLKKFMTGAKQALVHVSNCLADGKFDSLKDLITDEAMTEIRENFSLFSAKQLEEIRFQLEDIIYSFPYRIGVIMNDNDDKRFVEITVVFYCLFKYQLLKERPNLSYDQFRREFGSQITVCNFRFIRDYTKGEEHEWIVNQLGYFKNV